MMETTMDDTEYMHVDETPRQMSVDSSGRSSSGYYDSVDSGYLTPQSSTPLPETVRATRSSSKKYRLRPSPWQRRKQQRHRQPDRRSSLKHEPPFNFLEYDSLIDSSGHRSALESELSAGSDGLAHSTPSCANDAASCERGTTATAVGARLGRTSWTIGAKPAALTSAEPRLASPPSPAVPAPYGGITASPALSSYTTFVAARALAEPDDDDAEMRLMVESQERTPRIAGSPSLKAAIPRILVSPPRGRYHGVAGGVASADGRQLSKLVIAERSAAPEIRPKRLDFSHRGLFGVPETRETAAAAATATAGRTGREKVDFLSLFGAESNHMELVSKILSYVEPRDLCAISMVSTTWRRICESDPRANRRRITHILRNQNIKENLRVPKRAKHEEDAQTSPRSRRSRARIGWLVDVQNLLHVPAQPRPPDSPPVSPSKVKFHCYVKASSKLAHGEHLLRCPRCTFPCHVDNEKNVGTCSRQGCSLEFCASCTAMSHTGPCKTSLLATPTKRNKRLVVCSRQSKRNLRRL